MMQNTVVDQPINAQHAAVTAPMWLAVASLAVGTFATVTTEFLPIGLLTNIATSLQVTEGTAGLMVTLPGIAAAFAGPVLIIASGRLDRRWVLLALSALLVASNLLSALAPNFATMLVARVLLGLCVGGFWTFAPGATGQLVPPALRARAISYVVAGVAAATVAGVPAGALLGDLVGWRAVFGVATAVSVAVLALQLWLLPSMPPARAIRPRDLLKPLQLPAARTGLLVALFLISGHFAAYTYLKPMLREIFGLSSGAVAALLLTYGLAGFIGTFVGGILAARSARLSTIVASSMIAVVLLLSALAGSGLVGGTLLAFVWGAAFGLVPVSMTTWMVESVPHDQEAGQAMMVTAFQIAIASGALLGGIVVDATGVGGTMLLGGGLAVAATLLIVPTIRARQTVTPMPCTQAE